MIVKIQIMGDDEGAGYAFADVAIDDALIALCPHSERENFIAFEVWPFTLASAQRYFHETEALKKADQ